MANQTRLIKFKNAKVTASLCDWGDGTSSLAYLYSKDKGLGYGTDLMKCIIEYADSHQIKSIYLEVDRYGPKSKNALTNDQLVVFYSKFGFVIDPEVTDRICMQRISEST